MDEIGLIDQNHWGNRGSSGIVDRSCIATFKLNNELHYMNGSGLTERVTKKDVWRTIFRQWSGIICFRCQETEKSADSVIFWKSCKIFLIYCSKRLPHIVSRDFCFLAWSLLAWLGNSGKSKFDDLISELFHCSRKCVSQMFCYLGSIFFPVSLYLN